MKKTFLITAAVLMTTTAAIAQTTTPKSNPDKGLYIGLFAGASYPNISVNRTTKLKKENANVVGGLALGYQVNDAFRFDINSSHRSIISEKNTNKDKLECKITTLFVNVYGTLKTNTVFTPYVTAGIGIAGHDVDYEIKQTTTTSTTTSTTKLTTTWRNKGIYNVFAWNVGAGSQVKFTDSFSGDIAYRYVDFGKGGNSNLVELGAKAHEVTAGLIFKF